MVNCHVIMSINFSQGKVSDAQVHGQYFSHLIISILNASSLNKRIIRALTKSRHVLLQTLDFPKKYYVVLHSHRDTAEQKKNG